ncbi:MAG: hypothetical protein AB7O97_19760 [Planctomycetota bacterium]
MADWGQVGGLEPLHDRHGPLPHPREDHPAAQGERDPAPPGADSAALSGAAEVVYPLLRQRVLAATQARLGAGARPRTGTFWRGGAPGDPAVAVAWIRGEQRWLCDGADLSAETLIRAFDAGWRETRDILREVHPEAKGPAAWLRAVRDRFDALGPGIPG